jgi:serine/threonine protein kinase
MASAVQHAHARLVVHCDLKPANVLVTAGGVPQLVDFGIARVLGGRSSERALTPGYASPEQLAGQPLGVASDVWSLGVVLYELVSGKRPFAGAPAGTVPPASAAVTRSDLADAGCPPPAPPARLARALRGDLDALIARALALEPAGATPRSRRSSATSRTTSAADRWRRDPRATRAAPGSPCAATRRRAWPVSRPSWPCSAAPSSCAATSSAAGPKLRSAGGPTPRPCWLRAGSRTWRAPPATEWPSSAPSTKRAPGSRARTRFHPRARGACARRSARCPRDGPPARRRGRVHPRPRARASNAGLRPRGPRAPRAAPGRRPHARCGGALTLLAAASR